MNALDELIERYHEALAGRGEALTPLERAVAYYESPEAADDFTRLQTIEQKVWKLFETIELKQPITHGRIVSQDALDALEEALKTRT